MGSKKYLDLLEKYLAVIRAALGGESPARPEMWSFLTDDLKDADDAKRRLDAAAHHARELRQYIAAAEAAKEMASQQVDLARQRIKDAEEKLQLLEENLVRPLLVEYGEGKQRQIDTGFARVSLRKLPGKVVLSERGRQLGEADAVALLPIHLVRLHAPEPDKKKIAEELRQGVVLDGFELTADETRVDWRS